MNRKYQIALAVALGLTIIGGTIYIEKKMKPVATRTVVNAKLLDTLHPKYKDRFYKFIKRLTDLGYKVQINSVYRDFVSQAKQKKADKRNASPGLSKHNYGLAVDLQLSKGGKVFGKNTPLKTWINTGVPNLAKSMGLEWGGNFPGYPDAVHFAVAGIDTSTLQKLAYKQFNTTDPTKIKGNAVKLAQRGYKQRCGCMGEHSCYLF